MSIRIPPDAKIVRDARLDLIRIICILHDKIVEADDGIKAKVKETMEAKGATYAESDLVVAALRAGAARSSIDARRLYKLVEAGELTISQFLDCVSVSKKPLEKYLAGERIEKLATAGTTPAPSLTTELKQGAQIDVDRITAAILDALSAVPINAK